MAKPVLNIKLKHLKLALKDFQQFGDEGEKVFSEITENNAHEIVLSAKQLAPKRDGRLFNSIRDKELKRLKWVIFTNVKYAPYMEFGTGRKVDVPPELASLSIKFKGRGIKQVNIRPQPFLYPSFAKVRPRYIKDLDKALIKLSKKHSD